MRVPSKAYCRAAFRSIVVGFTLVTLVGCGSGKYPVEGKVLFRDGKPATELAGGTVMFESKELHVSAIGEIDKDATFRLTTSVRNDGAPPGKYRVAVTPPEDEGIQDDKPGKKRRALLDPRFRSIETSNLEATVEKKKNELTVTVERANP